MFVKAHFSLLICGALQPVTTLSPLIRSSRLFSVKCENMPWRWDCVTETSGDERPSDFSLSLYPVQFPDIFSRLRGIYQMWPIADSRASWKTPGLWWLSHWQSRDLHKSWTRLLLSVSCHLKAAAAMFEKLGSETAYVVFDVWRVKESESKRGK